MFYFKSIFFLVLFYIIINSVSCFNMSDLLTSSYAQVSRNNEGRSHGQTPWTHSSDVHIIRGQNLPRPQYEKNKKFIHKNDNIGEVIQDRFNPKPWFGYEPSPSSSLSSSSSSSSASLANQTQDLTVPFDSFPLQLKPDDKNNPPKNNYGSMFTSYDAPPALSAPPTLNKKKPNYVTYEAPTTDESENDTPSDANTNTDTDEGPPISQIYNHPYKNNHDNVKYPGLPEYLDHNPNEQENQQYYYNHHFDHHGPPIYHEIIKTTTEAAAEDQRLNKKPYSYYYLGRKLWYIPLYFSVYFIIYIFVLILKSIARHKITFNHYFEEDKREMKDAAPDIHELEHHVLADIHAAKRKYIM